jgi:hypothetical protein
MASPLIPCPCCRGKGLVPAAEGARLTPQQCRIYEALAKRPHTNLELQAAMYGDRPDGPDNGNIIVNVMVKDMKARLRPLGLTIRSSGGQGARYRLEAIGD